MAWWNRATAVVADAESTRAQVAASARVYRWPVVPNTLQWPIIGNPARISRQEAEAIPACSRAVDLVTTTVAGLPIERFDYRGTRKPESWLAQPEENRTRFSTFNLLGRDLIFEGSAYLLKKGDGGRLQKGKQEYLPAVEVDEILNEEGTAVVAYEINGYRINDTSRVMKFDGWHDGILNHGAKILRLAADLEESTGHVAREPLPQQILKNDSNYELSDEEIDALLDSYRKARTETSIAYLNAGVSLDTVSGFDANQMQLVQAREFTAAQICNLVGVPAHMVAGAVNTSGTVTYANVTQENRSFIDFGLNPLIKAIESRLTAEYAGGIVRFNLAGLLRGNPTEIADLIVKLLPLGVITPEVAAAWMDLVPEGNTTA